jgi:high-affinity nickel-transport protein
VPSHSHKHSHDDPEHAHALLEQAHGDHAHVHAHLREVDLSWLRGAVRDAGFLQLARSLAVGLVHGLAGSAAVALLVLSTIREPRAAVCYLLVFGVGTMAGMLILSALMEFAMFKLARSWDQSERLLTFATGLISFCFGLWLAYQLGVVDGLFSAQPRWIPS